MTYESLYSLEASRLSLDDPLLECLAIVATRLGRRTTAAALSAGLPVHGEEMASPAAFARAAERVSLKARLARAPLEDIAGSLDLPCILVLRDNNACILQGQGRGGLRVVFPETPDAEVEVPFGELAARYRNYAFFVRPRAVADERGGRDPAHDRREWFWNAIRLNRSIYYEVAAAALFVNLLALASPVFTMNVYDRVIPNNAISTLWMLALGVLIAYVFDFVLKNLRAHFVDAAARKADNAVSARLFEQMMGMKMSARPASVGVHVANLREFETLRDFFTSATIIAFIDLPFILIFIGAMWLIAGPVAFWFAALVPLVIAAGFLQQGPLARIVRDLMAENASRNGLVFEVLSGLETIKVQAAEAHMQRKWEELTEQASKTNQQARHAASFSAGLAAFLANICSAAVVVYGAYLVQEQRLTPGGLIAAVILSGRIMAPLSAIAALLARFSQSRESLLRLDRLMIAPVERAKGQTFIPAPSMKGRIEFRDVVFRYPQQKTPALQGVSFSIEPGEHVGVIGPVGSGKTTLERLILNLYQPESGSVQVDGVDVRQIDPADLRRNIGVVQQTPYLFRGSVRENITLGHEAVPDAAVLRAAEIAGVMSFIAESDAGLETEVGERGENLSGGQRQAIAIARALLYDPPVLLLDEPTASIDPGSERKLIGFLEEAVEGKTVILITHRGKILKLVDRLILLERGRVIGAGDKGEVIGRLRGGGYRTADASYNTEM